MISKQSLQTDFEFEVLSGSVQPFYIHTDTDILVDNYFVTYHLKKCKSINISISNCGTKTMLKKHFSYSDLRSLHMMF